MDETEGTNDTRPILGVQVSWNQVAMGWKIAALEAKNPAVAGFSRINLANLVPPQPPLAKLESNTRSLPALRPASAMLPISGLKMRSSRIAKI